MGNGFFSPTILHHKLVNVYKLPRTSSKPRRPITPHMIFGGTNCPMLVAGDFNLHHLASDPTHVISDKEYCESESFFALASEQGLNLLNITGISTCFSFTSEGRPSVLDLAFTSASLALFVENWSTPYLSTASDAVQILVSLMAKHIDRSRPVPDWALTEWETAAKCLWEFSIPPTLLRSTLAMLDSWFDAHATRLHRIIAQYTPTKVSPLVQAVVVQTPVYLEKGTPLKVESIQKTPLPRLVH